MKNKFKRRISGVLAFLMCFTALFSSGAMPVHAATQTSEGYMVSYPREGDSGADRGTGTWGHTSKSLMNGWNVDAVEVFTAHAQDSYTDKVCYCIEPGVARHVGDTYSGFGEAFHTIHNYIDTKEMILRKGAIAAHAGEKVLIPINMRDGSVLAIGKGNPEWNYSAPHGAGRIMSRTKAKNDIVNITLHFFLKDVRSMLPPAVNHSIAVS